jgi:solute carrier family 25 carnitine/acylcarnitine transporter 20/29
MAQPAAPPLPVPVWQRFVAGTVSGAALVLVGHPLDTLRVKLQVDPAARLSSAFRALASEGVRGFYRGFLPPFLFTGLVNTILWGTTFSLCDHLAQRGWGDPTSRAVLATVPASLLSALVVVPMEGLKTRQQTEGGGRRTPLPALCARVLREEGARGLYRGWAAVICARVCGGWAYFGGNAFWLARLNEEWLPARGSAWARTRNVLIAGGLAGVGYWIPALPFDTVKSRLMASGSAHAGPRECAAALWREAGLRGFYRGWQPAMLRAFPANAAAFTAFDATMRALQ